MNAYDMKTGTPIPRQISPLEEGVWLMPGGCTDVEPPEFDSKTHTCKFNGINWDVVEIPIPEPIPEPEPYVPTYADKRLEEYGATQEQIEFITENGLEAWQTRVASIKEKYPKE